jgi:hypothetical protein
MCLQMLPEYAAEAGFDPLKRQQGSLDSRPLLEPATLVFYHMNHRTLVFHSSHGGNILKVLQ